MGVQPICFWDVMPIPRHALTIAPCTEQPNTGAGPNSHAAPRGKPRTTPHDYHPRHDKVNAPNYGCRCSKIMSPLNYNETLSPCEDGDDESERVSTGESN